MIIFLNYSLFPKSKDSVMKKWSTIYQSKWFFVSVLGFLFGCQSPKKLVIKGHYDRVINKMARKLEKKGQVKDQHLLALVEAFHFANERDMAQIDHILTRAGTKDLEYGLGLINTIAHRQDKLESHLPIHVSTGKSKFQFVNIDRLEEIILTRLTTNLTEDYQRYIAEARDGYKKAGKRAYQILQKLTTYDRHNQYVEELDEAHQLGREYVLVRWETDTWNITPIHFQRLSSNYLVGKHDFWREYHYDRNDEISYDLIFNHVIRDIFISPERVSEREYVERKRIKDGYRAIRDEAGHVVRDSLGNPMKEIKYKQIKARVWEVFQDKQLILEGYTEILNGKSGKLIKEKPFTVNEKFSHTSAHFRGDRRALPLEIRKKCKVDWIPFPSDEEMVREAARSLYPILRTHIESQPIAY